ncbi:hypothetical protein CAPTEDRAFT_186844 [Capitella teleta]|uniref:Rab-GAP TBC domain-containing protein n=1 Tax=Capitella teleta TaxID=283909 RepID=R7U5V9_CAPTE|nr:hypothetical protein CAPTEDRAFT_186844 [Capitella teleta]|eukprot:ELU01451.1 hypothetical protein CAPTEDRAFT_186844 [Capitella teleta]
MNDVDQILLFYAITNRRDRLGDENLLDAEEGITSLLRKWPDMKAKLHVCFNQPLPLPLRQLAWQLYLDNTKVRKKYVELLNNNPRAAISSQDLDISSHCEELLLSEPTFSNLKGSIGAFYAMKAILSYYHSSKKTSGPLSGIDYLLAVPFIEVASSKISRREPAPGHIVALLVEEFFTFMSTRPSYMEDLKPKNEGLKAFCTKVANHILARSPETSKVIVEAFASAKDKNKASDAANEAVLADAIEQLVHPTIRSMFVGYVNMDVLLYIWDQYIIGLDAPGFHDEFLPAVLAIYLMLVKENLRAAETVSRYFLEDLEKLLNADTKAALPTLDPTLG